jgi:hypothetical protein
VSFVSRGVLVAVATFVYSVTAAREQKSELAKQVLSWIWPIAVVQLGGVVGTPSQ